MQWSNPRLSLSNGWDETVKPKRVREVEMRTISTSSIASVEVAEAGGDVEGVAKNRMKQIQHSSAGPRRTSANRKSLTGQSGRYRN